MIHRSSRGIVGAPVRTGRALRRVSATMITLLLTVLAGVLLAPAATAADAGDPEITAVLDRAPDMPGVSLTVQTSSVGSQFVLDNPTPTEVTVLSAAGDPLFRIGPGGVLANFRSPDWYSSKSAETETAVPPRAADRGRPVWVRVSQDPAWGWFDHRLREASLSPDQKASMSPMDAFGNWSVPVLFGDRQGSADGHFEYRPPLGSFTPSLSDTQPAPGVTLTALPGDPTPGVGVNNQGTSEVVVLGQAGEPFLRLTPKGAEGNELSPTWLAQQGGASPATGDPAAAPRWRSTGTSPQVSFTVPWADPDRPIADLYRLSGSTDVRDWTIGLVVDGKRVDVQGVTTFNPADRPGIGVWWWIGGSVVLLAVVLGGLWWWSRRRRPGPGARAGDDAGSRRTPVDATH